MTPIQPTSWLGIAVLLIFSIGMLLIILEARLHMDKFKPALFMLSSFLLIGLYTFFPSDDPQRFEHFVEMQKENRVELFSLIAFMAFMWMIVEMLSERGVFSTLNSYLITKGPNASAMIFGKSIKEISRNQDYRHVALCNLIIASNSGVWFLGTATSLMVVLAGKISIMLIQPAFCLNPTIACRAHN